MSSCMHFFQMVSASVVKLLAIRKSHHPEGF